MMMSQGGGEIVLESQGRNEAAGRGVLPTQGA